MPFSKLNLSSILQQLLQKNGYTKPTPIQEKVIPLVLAHKRTKGPAPVKGKKKSKKDKLRDKKAKEEDNHA